MSLELLPSTKRLLLLLGEATKSPKNHILYDYILDFNRYVGAGQSTFENMADFLGISLSYERYVDYDSTTKDQYDEGITLREVFYYELFYYLKYAEPNLKKMKLPSTENIIKMSKSQFEKIYFRLYPKGHFEEAKVKNRLSTISDYAQGKYAKKII